MRFAREPALLALVVLNTVNLKWIMKEFKVYDTKVELFIIGFRKSNSNPIINETINTYKRSDILSNNADI